MNHYLWLIFKFRTFKFLLDPNLINFVIQNSRTAYLTFWALVVPEIHTALYSFYFITFKNDPLPTFKQLAAQNFSEIASRYNRWLHHFWIVTTDILHGRKNNLVAQFRFLFTSLALFSQLTSFWAVLFCSFSSQSYFGGLLMIKNFAKNRLFSPGLTMFYALIKNRLLEL